MMVCSCRDEKLKLKSFRLEFFCDPGRIQTCNLLIRSQMLYSVELRDPLIIFANERAFVVKNSAFVIPAGFKPATF